MFRLYDERDSSFEMITDDLEKIKNYLSVDEFDYLDCQDIFDIRDLLNKENAGMVGYQIEEI